MPVRLLQMLLMVAHCVVVERCEPHLLLLASLSFLIKTSNGFLTNVVSKVSSSASASTEMDLCQPCFYLCSPVLICILIKLDRVLYKLCCLTLTDLLVGNSTYVHTSFV